MHIEFLHGLCEMVQSGLDRSETADIGPKLSGPKTRPPVRSSAFMRPQTRPTADQTKDRTTGSLGVLFATLRERDTLAAELEHGMSALSHLLHIYHTAVDTMH
jgi:hypothetical protein